MTRIDIDSEQYRAIVRVRLRRFLRRRGVPAEATRALRSLPELRAVAVAISRGRSAVTRAELIRELEAEGFVIVPAEPNLATIVAADDAMRDRAALGDLFDGGDD